MNLQLYRIAHTDDATIGILCIENEFFCFTLEDEKRDVKVKGETRIPQGYYMIKWREVLSGMTKSYRERFPWFKWHMELQNVENFDYVYIHVGNTDEDTDGCILVGRTADAETMFVGHSTETYKKLYERVGEALNNGETVFIRVMDFLAQ